MFLRIVIDNDYRFHLLKHFRNINDNYIEKLVSGSSYTRTEVDVRIAKTGSKFNESFAKNPDELFQRLNAFLNDNETMFRDNNGRIEISFKYSKNEFPEGIGTDNIIAVSELPMELVKQIKYESRKGESIGYVKYGDVITWEINLILSIISDTEARIVTVFPGMYAPAFPCDFEPGTDAYIKSREFWKKYVFVVN